MLETIDSIDPTIRSSKLSGELLFGADWFRALLD